MAEAYYVVRPGVNLSSKEVRALDGEVFWGSLKFGGLEGLDTFLVITTPIIVALGSLLAGLVTGTLAGFLLREVFGLGASVSAGAGVGAAAFVPLALFGYAAYSVRRLTRRARAKRLLASGQVIPINNSDLGAVIGHANEAAAALPKSLGQDVVREVREYSWRLAQACEEGYKVKNMDKRLLTAQQLATRDEAARELETTQAALASKLKELSAKAEKAGSLEGANSERGLAAALALASTLRQPVPDALGGPLLDAYIGSYSSSDRLPTSGETAAVPPSLPRR